MFRQRSRGSEPEALMNKYTNSLKYWKYISSHLANSTPLKTKRDIDLVIENFTTILYLAARLSTKPSQRVVNRYKSHSTYSRTDPQKMKSCRANISFSKAKNPNVSGNKRPTKRPEQ